MIYLIGAGVQVMLSQLILRSYPLQMALNIHDVLISIIGHATIRGTIISNSSEQSKAGFTDRVREEID
jgi:hypothetical protein